MVSSRLVECPEETEDLEMGPNPDMMFALGEEPVGVRILTYQSSTALKQIFNALDEDEVEIIRQSAFGKLVEIAEKPVFSGRFARYMLSRQLKTKKKYETWFRFAGKPVRFSLREFAIVTGLPCGKYPKKSKMKLKDTIAEQPYWPCLFGRVDSVSVDAVIKMLYRKTVTDREIRVKYACLALLEGVLLPTSRTMKISRDHVEAIKDLDVFFSYPWGRVAFEMLILSIKERDAIALSRDTISVKGFVLAMQLVMIQAIPALTEVVQDACSSSESDRGEIEGNGREIFAKKQSLNPSHARCLDKKNDVPVTSLLLEDTVRPLSDEELNWSEEEDDTRVSSMVARVTRDYPFTISSFGGGLRRIDVDRMCEFDRKSGKSRRGKKIHHKGQDVQAGYMTALVIERIKPQFCQFEKELNITASNVVAIEGKVCKEMEARFEKFREEIMTTVKELVSSQCKDHTAFRNVSVGVERPSQAGGNISEPQANVVEDANAGSIRDTIRDISEYSTPPRTSQLNENRNLTPPTKDNTVSGYVCLTPVPQSRAQSATSENRGRRHSFSGSFEVQKTHSKNPEIEPSFSLGLTQEETREGAQPINGEGAVEGERLSRTESANIENRECLKIKEKTLDAAPSFSLGLTQEEHVDKEVPNRRGLIAQVGSNVAITVDDTMEFASITRKSKRQKTVPTGLVEDYECCAQLLSRRRKSERCVFVLQNMGELNRKYEKLVTKLKGKVVLNVAGLAVYGREIGVIVDRPRVYPAKVVDILLRVLKSTISRQINNDGLQSVEFLDSKFASTIIRNFPKFRKSNKKEVYVFPKGISEVFPSKEDPRLYPSRYYFPFNLGNKHWVGICFEAVCGSITVLDCNVAANKDSEVERVLNPVSQMLPYLARYVGEPIGEDPVIQCYDFARPKSVSQNTNPSDSGLMAVLFMAKHAMFGLEACKSVRNDMLEEEGKRAAILTYEFHEVL